MINSTLSESARQAHIITRLDALETRLRSVPSRWARGGDPQVYYLQCLDGNLLFTVSSVNYYGLSRPSSAIDRVPTATPSATAGALSNGLSRGYLIANNGTQTTVWIGNNLKPGVWSGGSIVAGSAVYNDFLGYMSNGNTFISRNAVRMPVDGSADTYATVYNPWRV